MKHYCITEFGRDSRRAARKTIAMHGRWRRPRWFAILFSQRFRRRRNRFIQLCAHSTTRRLARWPACRIRFRSSPRARGRAERLNCFSSYSTFQGCAATPAILRARPLPHRSSSAPKSDERRKDLPAVDAPSSALRVGRRERAESGAPAPTRRSVFAPYRFGGRLSVEN